MGCECCRLIGQNAYKKDLDDKRYKVADFAEFAVYKVKNRRD
jgi:hypothetical protein